MKEFIAMWKNYANFTGVTSVRGYWMAFLVGAIINIVVEVLYRVTGSTVIYAISMIYAVAGLIPSLAIAVRRYRDAGKRWTNLFFMLIPVVGQIICIYFLTKKSVNPDVEYV